MIISTGKILNGALTARFVLGVIVGGSQTTTYDEYFRENSVVTFAQAAGRYTGPADIEEYHVRFVCDTSSLYFDSGVLVVGAAAHQLKRISVTTGHKDFLIDTPRKNTTSLSSTLELRPSHNVTTRIFYKLPDSKILSIRIFFSQSYLDLFFEGLLNT